MSELLTVLLICVGCFFVVPSLITATIIVLLRLFAPGSEPTSAEQMSERLLAAPPLNPAPHLRPRPALTSDGMEIVTPERIEAARRRAELKRAEVEFTIEN